MKPTASTFPPQLNSARLRFMLGSRQRDRDNSEKDRHVTSRNVGAWKKKEGKVGERIGARWENCKSFLRSLRLVLAHSSRALWWRRSMKRRQRRFLRRVLNAGIKRIVNSRGKGTEGRNRWKKEKESAIAFSTSQSLRGAHPHSLDAGLITLGGNDGCYFGGHVSGRYEAVSRVGGKSWSHSRSLTEADLNGASRSTYGARGTPSCGI